uniref:Large subunit of meta-cleavage enzyme n=1 Tax=carbazole-degrading bacterium OC11S TaxID=512998 RepID=C4B8G4_UNCXX|nr:large subunit of meta-cleavage enzyme [carbazole-degrading bacterium OC11S]
MADIVVAAGTSHILMSPNGIEEASDRVFDGMIKVGRAVRAAKPDVIFIISNDHQFNLDLSVKDQFLVATDDGFTPFGEMDIPLEPFPGKADFAREFVEFASGKGVDAVAFEGLRPDHGTAVPLLFSNPGHDIPVVPLLVNLAADTAPDAKECWKAGEVLGSFIRDQRPEGERVAIVAAGGLSHWVGFDDLGINEEFDHKFLKDVGNGDYDYWVNLPMAEIEKQSGNGGLEIVNWLMMAAAVNGAKGETVFYEPMPEWMTGMGGVLMQL